MDRTLGFVWGIFSTLGDLRRERDHQSELWFLHRKDSNNVPEYVQRHLLYLSIWEELRSRTYLFFLSSFFSSPVLCIGSIRTKNVLHLL